MRNRAPLDSQTRTAYARQTESIILGRIVTALLSMADALRCIPALHLIATQCRVRACSLRALLILLEIPRRRPQRLRPMQGSVV